MKKFLTDFVLQRWGHDPVWIERLARFYDAERNDLFLDRAAELIGRRKRLSGAFDFDPEKVPARVTDFEDCAFLFFSSILNNGIARLRFDEAALLFRTVRGLAAPAVVEIGRFFGGSTFLIAAALQGRGSLLSIDFHAPGKMSQDQGVEYDRRTRAALEKANLAGPVKMVVGDSQTYDTTGLSPNVIFVDGDHSYEGVKRDFQTWSRALQPGGVMLLHDANPETPFGVLPVDQGVVKLAQEIGADPAFTLHAQAGSIIAFRKH